MAEPELNLAARDEGWRPLADRMRPATLDEFVGQQHLLAPGKPLRRLLEGRSLHSMLLWGPPGTGKTTLAPLVARTCDAAVVALSAVMAGVKDVRAAVEHAQALKRERGRQTVLFLDEVHRFNKSQQDAFLPYVEDGTVCFIGATTENPSFEINSALLSRARVYVLRSLTIDDVREVLRRALEHEAPGGTVPVEPEALETLARAADGDARRALNLLEVSLDLARAGEGAEQGLLRAGSFLEPEGEKINLETLSLKKIRKRASNHVEKALISHVLVKTGWNRSKASRILKVSYKTLLQKIDELGIAPPPELA